MEAGVGHGFDLYLSQKQTMESTGDPIQDIRTGWDAHVAFGLDNPGFYALMYGKVRPGFSSAAQSRPSEILLSLTSKAAGQGRLSVSPEQATAHVLATNIGVTLRQIILDDTDSELSAAVREGVIAAITGVGPHSVDPVAATAAERASVNRPFAVKRGGVVGQGARALVG